MKRTLARDQAEDDDRQGVTGLQHLHLDIQAQTKETQDTLARIFPVAGVALETLTVEVSGYPLSADGLVSIFQSYPRLCELVVNEMEPPSHPIDFDPATSMSHGLIKLKLRLAEANVDDQQDDLDTSTSFLDQLIAQVGAKLEYLEVRRESHIIPFVNDFRAIVAACPGLYHLKLECLDIGSLQPLIEAYRSGCCRLSSLYLIKCPLDTTSVIHFTEFLSDHDCPSSYKLGVLHISESTSDISDASQLDALHGATLRVILAMLEVNRTLTELYVAVPETGTSMLDEPLRPFARRFNMFDEQEIPLASEAMTLQERVAFVSVLQHTELPWNPQVVAHIVGFVAQRVRRSVRFEVVS